MSKQQPNSPADLPPEWVGILRLLPGYDPFARPGDSWFDVQAAEHVLAFVPACIRHMEGDLAGQAFVLEAWQRSFLANLFGWKRTDEKGRKVNRYREALLYVPRKNGKTPLAAAIALYVLFCDSEKGQQNYIAAADREQAGMLFRQAKGMVEQEPRMLERARVYGGNAEAGQSRSIVRTWDNSFVRVVSADANSKHGGNSKLIIVDELHAQPNRDLVDVLTTSTASLNRRQPLTLYLTTADFDRPSICNEKHEHACRVRDGEIDDPAFLPAVWEAAREDDWTSEEVWAKANPNLGVSVSLDYLRREGEKAKDNPSYENTFRRLHLNQKTSNDVRAIPMDRWDACGELPLDLDDLAGRPCFGGLDLASTTDLAALALLFPLPVEGGYAVLMRFWAPKEGARRREKNHRVPYLTWARQDHVKLTDGDVIDYDIIREDVRELGETYNIQEIAADRWNSTQLLTQLQGDGFKVVAFGQGFQSMTAPTKELLGLVLGGRLAHGNQPVLRWMAGNLAVEIDAADNRKPSKKKSTEKIDGMVALIMALGRAMTQDTGSTYDTQGITFL